MKRNPFEKYLGKEDHLQMQVAQYLNAQYPNVLWNHIPNEGKRTAFEQYKAKHFGIKAGMPDVMIFEPRLVQTPSHGRHTIFTGLAIELKIKPNKPTKSQMQVLESLRVSQWWVEVCYSFEEAKEIIDNYLR